MIEGVVLAHLLAARPRPAEDPHAPGSPTTPARSRRRGSTSPGSRRSSTPGTQRPPARQAEPLRLPGRELRPRRGDRDGRLRARLPRQRGARPEAAARARRRRRSSTSAPRATRCRRALAVVRAAAAPGRRARRAAPAALAGGGRGGPAAARLRRAPRPPARARPPDGRARAARRRGAARRPASSSHRYREVLPFTLTDAQERAIAEIDRDLARTTPMQRLLQGDVGSGKTVVALATLLRAVEAGRQGALMAPTEVLAEQHFLTIEGICTELGVRVALLTSALGAKEHANVRQLIASGDVADRGRHARADPEGGRLPRPRRRRRRRAAPLRRRAALGARRGAQPARPPHDRDADPAHARADRLRRPRRLGDHGAAREPQADRDGLGVRRPQLRGVRAAHAAPHGRAARRTSSAR